MNGCMNANGDMTEEKIYELSRSWMELRVADMNFTLDALIAGADNNDTGCYWFENDSSRKDVLDVLTHIDTDKIGLMGHSMGSYIARNYIERYGTGISGVILQGGNDTPRHMAAAGKLITEIMALFHGWRYRSDFCTKVTLGSCMKAFPEDPSGWVTKRSEVRERYKDDPLGGYTFTLNGFNTLAELALRAGDKRLMANIPRELPMLIISGAEDPVGEMGKGVRRMYELYKACGLKNIKLDIRPGDRHEVHNEEDRFQVFEEIKDFVYGGAL